MAQEAGGFSAPFASAKKLAHRSLEFLLLELRGDAHGVGQVVVTHPTHIDAGDAQNLVGVVDPFRGLHEGGHEGALILLPHHLDNVAAAIAVMGDAEAPASHAFRAVPAP